MTALSRTEVAVSVIIANWNKAQLTITCVQRLLQHIPVDRSEVIVVDNGSDPAEVERLRTALGPLRVRLIELNTNLYFGEANNIGAEAALGKYLLLLNNDTLVEPNFLEPLLSAMKAPKAAAAGPRFIYEDGSLQEAGAYLTPESWSVQHGKREPSWATIAGPGLHVVDYCSAACLLIEKSVFLNAAGFDPLYDPAYFEDADLCLRLRSQGGYTYFSSESSVVHLESKTSGESWNSGWRSRTIAENQRKFAERWGAYLANRLRDGSVPPSFPSVGWQPEPAFELLTSATSFDGQGQIQKNEEWISIVARASESDPRGAILFLADECASRCRVYSIARDIGVKLPPFFIRQK